MKKMFCFVKTVGNFTKPNGQYHGATVKEHRCPFKIFGGNGVLPQLHHWSLVYPALGDKAVLASYNL